MIRLGLLVPVLFVLSCSPDDQNGQSRSKAEQIRQVVSAWQSEADKRNDELMLGAEVFESSVHQFLADTNQGNLDAVRAAWRKVHTKFLTARVFFVGQTNDLAFRLDAWPIMEGFLDSVPGYPHSGIVNDYAVSVDVQSLVNQHGLTDREEASLGFHALEYFVFARALEDFLPVDPLHADTISRRREALRIMMELLVLDLEQFVGLSRSGLESLDGQPGTSNLLIKSLRNTTGRLALEADRLVHHDNGHSRFSETSWTDLEAQMEPLSRLLGPPVNMADLLAGVDERQAVNFSATVEQALIILTNDTPDDSERNHIPLLMAALNHQMEDLEP